MRGKRLEKELFRAYSQSTILLENGRWEFVQLKECLSCCKMSKHLITRHFNLTQAVSVQVVSPITPSKRKMRNVSVHATHSC